MIKQALSAVTAILTTDGLALAGVLRPATSHMTVVNLGIGCGPDR
jgi:hypothetical protein